MCVCLCVRVTLVIQHATHMRSIVMWSLRLYHIFPHYLINGTTFRGEKVIEHKMCVLIFFSTLSEIFLILRRIQRHTTINVHWSSWKVHVVFSDYSKL